MNKLCIKLIEFYQKKMSPGMSKKCKYYPTCSNYGLECYKRFDFFTASFLTSYRIVRCNPWSRGGYDPVPEKKAKLKKLDENYYILEYRHNTDRPNLAYILKGDNAYIIDAGNSKKHVKHFYKQIKKAKLPLPNYSIITHHHWDHTFGLVHTNTISMGLEETNEHLIRHKEILEDGGIKRLIKEKEIPAFCVDHIYLEYKFKLKTIQIKLLDEIIEDNTEIDNMSLFKFPSNHSNDNLCVLDNDSKILFLGDSLCGKIVDFDFIKDLEILKEQYKYLNNLDFNIAIESHQNPVTKEEILKKIKEKISELEK